MLDQSNGARSIEAPGGKFLSVICYARYLLLTERMSKLKLDLHDIFDQGDKIEQALNDVMRRALEKNIRLVEIIPGKGSGQLKKRVLRFLDQKNIRAMYRRLEKDDKNFGRIFVHL